MYGHGGYTGCKQRGVNQKAADGLRFYREHKEHGAHERQQPNIYRVDDYSFLEASS